MRVVYFALSVFVCFSSLSHCPWGLLCPRAVGASYDTKPHFPAHTHTHTHPCSRSIRYHTPLWTVFRYHIPLWIVFRYHAPLWIDLIDFDCSIPVPASGWRGDYTSLLLWPHLRAVDGAGRRPGNQTPAVAELHCNFVSTARRARCI